MLSYGKLLLQTDLRQNVCDDVSSKSPSSNIEAYAVSDYKRKKHYNMQKCNAIYNEWKREK